MEFLTFVFPNHFLVQTSNGEEYGPFTPDDFGRDPTGRYVYFGDSSPVYLAILAVTKRPSLLSRRKEWTLKIENGYLVKIIKVDAPQEDSAPTAAPTVGDEDPNLDQGIEKEFKRG